MKNNLNIVAVTACVTGVAHTYMAAEKLTKYCNSKGYRLIVETQGVLGSEQHVDETAIENADVVIITSDINIAGIERFSKPSRLITVSISDIMLNIDKLFRAIDKIMMHPKGSHIDI
jgi:fructose-specific PTS system IIB-like component